MTADPLEPSGPSSTPDAEELGVVFAQLLGAASTPAALVAAGRRHAVVVSVNAALEELLGRADLVGRDLSEIAAPDDPFDLGLRERIAAGQLDVVAKSRRYLRGDGTSVRVNSFGVVVRRTPELVYTAAIFVEPGRIDWMRGRLRRDEQVTAALGEVRGALLAGAHTDDVLRLICMWTKNLLSADASGLMEREGVDMVRLRATADPAESAGDLVWRIIDDEFGKALRSDSATGYTVSPATFAAAGGRQTLPDVYSGDVHIAVAPVETAGVPFGALVARRGVTRFDEDDIAMLQAFASGVSEAVSVAEARADLEWLRVLEVRQHIARDLHDEVIQDLIGVRLALAGLVPAATDPEVAGRLVALRDELNRATMRLRDVVAGLDADTAATDFTGLLESLTRGRAERADMGWTLAVTGAVDGLVHDERGQLMSVLNEAVSNAVRHSDGTELDIRLVIDAARVVLTVEDDGVGPSGAATTGMGLRNLGARAQDRGGDFSIGARPGGGTRLEWWIPRLTRS